MPDPKVYATSFFCEKLLREKDDVLTAVRMADVFNFTTAPPEAVRIIETNFVTLFKCEVQKDFVATISGVSPTGRSFGSYDVDVHLKGGAEGHIIVAPLLLQVTEFGVYWMQAAADGEVIQRVPLVAQEAPAPKVAELRHRPTPGA